MRPLKDRKGMPVLAMILDHAGNCRHFGPPLFDRPWTLDPKQKTKKSRGTDLSKQCPECETWTFLVAETCAVCDFRFYTPEKVKEDEAGELTEEELTPERRKELLAWLVRRGVSAGVANPEAWAERAIAAGVR
jgi:hypothetical protein